MINVPLLPLDTALLEKSPLLGILNATYAYLNSTHPNLTTDCWLWLDPKPLFYTGITLKEGNPSTPLVPLASTTALYPWTPNLILGDLQGEGTYFCTFNYPLAISPYSSICTNSCTYVLPNTKWAALNKNTLLVAPPSTWFACTLGMTPCFSLGHSTEEDKPELCVLVLLCLKPYTMKGKQGECIWGLQAYYTLGGHLLYLSLPIRIAGSTALCTVALITGDCNLQVLSEPTNRDIYHLHSSISFLENQVDMLAEVVLQNCRGVDLFFFREGDLCMTLGETLLLCQPFGCY